MVAVILLKRSASQRMSYIFFPPNQAWDMAQKDIKLSLLAKTKGGGVDVVFGSFWALSFIF